MIISLIESLHTIVQSKLRGNKVPNLHLLVTMTETHTFYVENYEDKWFVPASFYTKKHNEGEKALCSSFVSHLYPYPLPSIVELTISDEPFEGSYPARVYLCNMRNMQVKPTDSFRTSMVYPFVRNIIQRILRPRNIFSKDFWRWHAKCSMGVMIVYWSLKPK